MTMAEEEKSRPSYGLRTKRKMDCYFRPADYPDYQDEGLPTCPDELDIAPKPSKVSRVEEKGVAIEDETNGPSKDVSVTSGEAIVVVEKEIIHVEESPRKETTAKVIHVDPCEEHEAVEDESMDQETLEIARLKKLNPMFLNRAQRALLARHADKQRQQEAIRPLPMPAFQGSIVDKIDADETDVDRLRHINPLFLTKEQKEALKLAKLREKLRLDRLHRRQAIATVEGAVTEGEGADPVVHPFFQPDPARKEPDNDGKAISVSKSSKRHVNRVPAIPAPWPWRDVFDVGRGNDGTSKTSFPPFPFPRRVAKVVTAEETALHWVPLSPLETVEHPLPDVLLSNFKQEDMAHALLAKGHAKLYLQHPACASLLSSDGGLNADNKNMLWTETWAPMSMDALWCQGAVDKVSSWLSNWTDKKLKSKGKKRRLVTTRRKPAAFANIDAEFCPDKDDDEDDFVDFQRHFKVLGDPVGPKVLGQPSIKEKIECQGSKQASTLLLYGPTASGKTRLIYTVAEQMGFHVIEINSASARSGKTLMSVFSESTSSHSVRSSSSAMGSLASTHDRGDGERCKDRPKTKKTLLLLEEVDVMYESDKGFFGALQTFMSNTKRPIVMTSTYAIHEEPGFPLRFEHEQCRILRMPTVSPALVHAWMDTALLVRRGILLHPYVSRKLLASCLLPAHAGHCDEAYVDARRLLLTMQFLFAQDWAKSDGYRLVRTLPLVEEESNQFDVTTGIDMIEMEERGECTENEAVERLPVSAYFSPITSTLDQHADHLDALSMIDSTFTPSAADIHNASYPHLKLMYLGIEDEESSHHSEASLNATGPKKLAVKSDDNLQNIPYLRHHDWAAVALPSLSSNVEDLVQIPSNYRAVLLGSSTGLSPSLPRHDVLERATRQQLALFEDAMRSNNSFRQDWFMNLSDRHERIAMFRRVAKVCADRSMTKRRSYHRNYPVHWSRMAEKHTQMLSRPMQSMVDWDPIMTTEHRFKEKVAYFEAAMQKYVPAEKEL